MQTIEKPENSAAAGSALKQMLGADDLSGAFNRLKQIAKQRSKDTAKPSFGGSWTAEENRGDDVLRFTMSDGGYCQVIHSVKFGFEIWNSYTNDKGECFNLKRGDEAGIRACLAELSP